MGNFIIKALIIAIIAYLLVMMVLFFLQRQFMYFPPNDHPGLSSTTLADMQEIELTLSSGEIVPIWWHPPEKGQAVIVFFHGNGSSVYDGRFIYQYFMQQGFGVLGAEYPGYPGATGTPTQTRLIEAALAQYDFIQQTGVAPEEIYLYGTSLGAGVAAQLVSRRESEK